MRSMQLGLICLFMLLSSLLGVSRAWARRCLLLLGLCWLLGRWLPRLSSTSILASLGLLLLRLPWLLLPLLCIRLFMVWVWVGLRRGLLLTLLFMVFLCLL